MRRALLIACTLCALPRIAQATHIIGGELYYTHQGNDAYEVTLNLYRDCGPANSNGTGFDATVEIGVFDPSGAYLFSEFFQFPGATPVPVQLNNPCLTAPSTICVEMASYSGTILLPSGTGGYLLAYQRCCRTPGILNLNNPGAQGLTCAVEVPDASLTGPNSSPRFTAYPPIALCANQPLSFDHSATDPDGDQLVYELAEPYDGASNVNPMPSPPAGPPYLPITWAAGYSLANMINASPALAIDPATGLLGLTPTLVGSFVLGVRVKEFRNGQQLSEVTRDLRFDVVACQVTVLSAIQQQSSFCDGLTVNMVNQSIGTDFLWDFGVPGTLADTSDQVAPSYTYPDTGTYTVTLVANPGWPCADTSTSQFAVYQPLQVTFTAPGITCADAQPITLDATGNFGASAQIAWDLGPWGGAPALNTASVVATFTQPGTHPVQVDVTYQGCSGSHADTVVVHPVPVAQFTSDTVGCAPLQAAFLNTSDAWTPMTFLWAFGDGASSTAAQPLHVYTQPGLFDVSLTVTTDSGCVDTATLVLPGHVRVWPAPVAQFLVEPLSVSVLDPTITVTDGSVNAATWSFAVEGEVYTGTQFTHTFQGAGVMPVDLVVTSGPGCSDSTRVNVIVNDHLFHAPNTFTPNGDDVNEVWRPSVVGARLYDLSVFDRWGAEVFHTTDPQQGWDGAGYPQGTYVFKAWVSEHGPLERAYTGAVTLIR